MVKNQKMSQYRERLDLTLASHDLVNEKILAASVKNQLLRSMLYETGGLTESLLEKRTTEVSNFLDMLRSASMHETGVSKSHTKQHQEWKLKQDTEDCRIMYREGLLGSPFHSLLVEGYMDAPMDVCLCVSWESSLYKKWWPQYRLPAFKILSCKCSQKVQTGEQISLVRVQLSWPLSDREAFLHYFEFEYFKDDLVVVLINSVSGQESIDTNLGGLTNDGTAEEPDMVRIDMVGGFALQKVTSERSYFRTIMNMDIKLDYIPPSLINFISRQLVGNGFRLYQKAVASVSKSDEDFSRALGDPLYAQIRKALYSESVQNGISEQENLKHKVSHILPNEHVISTMRADTEDTDCKEKVIVQRDFHEIEEEEINSSLNLPNEHHPIQITKLDVTEHGENESLLLSAPVRDPEACPEIEENVWLDENTEGKDHHPLQEIEEDSYFNRNPKVFVRPVVGQALETLERIISLVQNVGFSSLTTVEQSSVSKDARKGSTSSEEIRVVDGKTGSEASNDKVAGESSAIDGRTGIEEASNDEAEAPDKNLDEPSSGICKSRPTSSNYSTRETNPNRIAPAASPEQNRPLPSGPAQPPLLAAGPEKTAAAPSSEETPEADFKKIRSDANGIHRSSPDRKRKAKRKHFLCCLLFESKKVAA